MGKNLYQSTLRRWKQRSWRLGYAAQSPDAQFTREVSQSLQRAAAAEGIELISVENRYGAKVAECHADLLVRQRYYPNDALAQVVREG